MSSIGPETKYASTYAVFCLAATCFFLNNSIPPVLRYERAIFYKKKRYVPALERVSSFSPRDSGRRTCFVFLVECR